MKYNKDKEKIVHLERYKVTPKDEDFKVMMITRTHDPEFSDVPNVGYCTLKDIRGWILKDIFYENVYFHNAMDSKPLEDLYADSSNTILYLENPKTKETMQYCIQGDPENNYAGYIGQSYFNEKGEQVALNV